MVATPIGNLADMTFRAVDVLRSCAVVAAEDTRRFRVLAERYGLRPRRVLRCDERTEERVALELIRSVEDGESAALTTDAGTPGVADPGRRTVELARRRGLRVVPVPGPSSPMAALSVSGLPGDRFAFAGFPPRAAGARRDLLQAWLALPATLVLLESPRRLLALLSDLDALASGRRIVVAREITKLHESFVTGTPADVRSALASIGGHPRGEIVVLASPPEGGAEGSAAEEGVRGERARAILARPWIEKLSRRDRADLLTAAFGLGRNAAYELAGEVGRG